MGEVLTNPIVVVVLIAAILGGGVFVISRFGKLGSGTGGVTKPTTHGPNVGSPPPKDNRPKPKPPPPKETV